MQQFWAGYGEDNDGNDNNNYGDYGDYEEGVLEFCEELYEQSAKCNQNFNAGDDDNMYYYAVSIENAVLFYVY